MTDADMLDTLRERGAPRIDPVRFRLIESMLRRADGHTGLARQWLDDKLAAHLQALNEVLGQAEAQSIPSVDRDEPGLGELGKLVAHIVQQKPGMADAVVQQRKSKNHDSPVDPKTLQFFRRTWSRLSSDQRLAQSRSSLPDNAGPLNSQHLVHRSLNVMRELSPEYFDLFISHVDALMWLERANEQAAKEVGLSPRAKGARKAAGNKRG